jgi:O-antigen ligase
MDKPAATEPETSLEISLGWLAVVLAFSLPLYRPWVTLATTAIFALWIFGGRFRSYAKGLKAHRLTLAVLCFVGLNIVSLLWSADPVAGVKYLTKYRYLLLIPMVASAVRPIYRRYAVNAFELAVGASVLLSLGVFFDLLRVRDSHPGNPSPVMAHLDYGLLLAFASLLILARVLYKEMPVLRRTAWSGLALLVIVGLFVNIGRSGQLAFVGGLTVLLIHWMIDRHIRIRIAIIVGFLLTLVALWFALPTFQTRVRQSRSDLAAALVRHRYDGNLGGRVAAFVVARDVFRENPLIGTGVGSNMPAFRTSIDTRFPQFKPSIYWYPHFHNQYTQIATELGLAGLIALAWIFWELIRVPDQRREVDAVALVLATVYLLGFLGEPYFHKQITLVLFSLFAGLISAEKPDTQDSAASSAGS